MKAKEAELAGLTRLYVRVWVSMVKNGDATVWDESRTNVSVRVGGLLSSVRGEGLFRGGHLRSEASV